LFEVPLAKRGDSVVVPSKLNERLLNAAVEVFLEKGFAAASVDEIAARAKASKNTFYNHYGNKEALFEAVMRRKNTALLESIKAKVPEGLPLEDFLPAFAQLLYAEFLKRDTVKLVRVLHAEANRFPQLANIFERAGPSLAMKAVAAEFEKHMVSGYLRKANAELAAEQFIQLSLGELTRRVLMGLRPAPSNAEISERITSGIDVFLRAYRI
jgi:TetR/AcrR family transcriptional regulator, mexJK operon transcriptional repressor